MNNAAAQGCSRGRGVAAVQTPAETILLTDSIWAPSGTSSELVMGYLALNPPQMWTGAPPFTRTSYGYVWPRHHNQATTLFADGHAKSLPINKLRDADNNGVSDDLLWDLE